MVIGPPHPAPSPRRFVAVGALRWGALIVGLLLVPVVDPAPAPRVAAAVAGLVVLAAVQTWLWEERRRSLLVLELVVALVAAGISGAWGSPFILSATVPVLLLSSEGGVRSGVGATLGAIGALLVAAVALEQETAAVLAVQGVLLLVLAAGVGTYAHAVMARAEEEHEQTLGRITQLGHVNAMLSTLHDVVRSMPAPLSVDEIVRVIRAQLDELFDADAVVLLLAEGSGERWRPVYAEGIELASSVPSLPAPVRERGPAQRPLVVPDLEPGSGLWSEARSGAYLWLWSRGRPSGLLALEHREPGEVDPDQSDNLERLANPLALAIDNAVWFQRLRTLGAEEERQRIGADLHDRFAQSLTYVAIELDRAGRRHPDDPDLERLRDDVRGTLTELRETLRELRTNVSEQVGLSEVLEDVLETFGDRFGVLVDLDADLPIRPPLAVEQQLLRITQDLLRLSQRESRATAIDVRVVEHAGSVTLTVSDDGTGRSEEEFGAEARELLSTVRERVDAIAGRIAVDSNPGGGRTVTVTVGGLL